MCGPAKHKKFTKIKISYYPAVGNASHWLDSCKKPQKTTTNRIEPNQIKSMQPAKNTLIIIIIKYLLKKGN